jgi:hypothetical protein
MINEASGGVRKRFGEMGNAAVWRTHRPTVFMCISNVDLVFLSRLLLALHRYSAVSKRTEWVGLFPEISWETRNLVSSVR